MQVLDLQDAYFHIAIHPIRRKYLEYQVGSSYYSTNTGSTVQSINSVESIYKMPSSSGK